MDDKRVSEVKDNVFQYCFEVLRNKDYKFDLHLFKHEFPQCVIEEIFQSLLNERSLHYQSEAIRFFCTIIDHHNNQHQIK